MFAVSAIVCHKQAAFLGSGLRAVPRISSFCCSNHHKLHSDSHKNAPRHHPFILHPFHCRHLHQSPHKLYSKSNHFSSHPTSLLSGRISSMTRRRNEVSTALSISNSIRGLKQESLLKAQAGRVISFLSPQTLVETSPAKVQPYLKLMRIDRPIGTWLLFLPCTWSISLAAPPGAFPDPGMLTLFALGSFFMRGAGCTVNDMWDKDFDAKVERTKDRPIAAGHINQFNALVFLGAQLSISLAILLTFNWNTIILGACSVIPCVIYPLMKRITFWPQIFLGLTFNWGSVMGWSALTGTVNLSVVGPLYLSCIAWTLVYDTIYAHQDKADDILVGVKSTALRMGDRTKLWLSGFTSLICAGLTGTGLLCDQTWPYYLGVAYLTGHLAHQIYSVDLSNPESCGEKFRSNRNLGLVFWAAVVAGNLLRTRSENEEE